MEAIQSPRELLPATYRDVVMSRWGQGRVGVVGDAAHAMSPQLGQGANMALLDAVAVARRDLALTVSRKVPWLKRQMAETVAGRKQTWWY